MKLMIGSFLVICAVIVACTQSKTINKSSGDELANNTTPGATLKEIPSPVGQYHDCYGHRPKPKTIKDGKACVVKCKKVFPKCQDASSDSYCEIEDKRFLCMHKCLEPLYND